MRKFISIALMITLLLLILAGCTSSQQPDNSTANENNTAANASAPPAPASTKLVVYSGLSEDDMMALSSAFKSATGIEMEYICANIGDLTARVDAEKDNPQADILLGGSVDLYDPVNACFEKYSSSANTSLDSRFNDPNGYWQGWYMGVLCILYNQDRFTSEIESAGIKAPATLDDLLDPAYKGEFLMGDPATAGGARIFIANQIFRLGKDKAWEYMKELDNNVNYYTPGAVTCIDLIGAGEFLIGMSWGHDTYKAKAAGQPIEIVIPPDTAYEIGGSAIIKNAQNKENAQSFINWLLTNECQELNTSLSYRYPVRADSTPPDGLPALSSVKLVDYNRAEAGNMMDEIREVFQSEILDKR